MKRVFFYGILFLMVLTMSLSVTGCNTIETEEENEVVESAVVTVEDPAYYQRFQDQDLSINVYNWGEYIPDGSEEGVLDLNAAFTELTGIQVNYSTFASNEEMYAKIKGGGVSYDIVIPSDYMISRMIKEDMLQALDFSNIPNQKNIMEQFKNPEYDPKNAYSVPYTWGTVGIIYDNTAIDPNEVELNWDILWDETYRDQILMFDNPRDAFAVAELLLGYSLNTEDPEELRRAAEKLLEQKSVIQAYVMDEIYDKMGAREAVLAPYYAGDAVTLMDEYDHLSFAIPESGTNLFVDALCIPKGAKQKEAAEMYINFMCEADVAYAVADFIGYSSPNAAGFALLDEEVQQDEITYPSTEYMEERTEVYRNLSDEANACMQELWTSMKSAEQKQTNPWLVPMFMLACVLLSLAILVRRYIRNKKDIF